MNSTFVLYTYKYTVRDYYMNELLKIRIVILRFYENPRHKRILRKRLLYEEEGFIIQRILHR